ncbi:MAG: type II secretion system protein GspM [Nitriliruptoraceae bacterium]
MTVLVGVLAVVLVGVLWYFLLWTPTDEEIAELRAQTQNEQQLADQARIRAEELRDVRERAPELESTLAVAEQLVPVDVGLPAILRQIQLAAADAGVTLENLAPSRPIAAGTEELRVEAVELSFNVQGTYFQLVDLARRLEDPALLGRGLTWRFGTFGIAEEFPTLSGSLAATVYARTPEVVAEGSEDEGEESGEDPEEEGEEGGDREPPPATDPSEDPPPRPDGDEEELIS